MALSTITDYPKLFIPSSPLRLFKIRVYLNYTDENCWKNINSSEITQTGPTYGYIKSPQLRELLQGSQDRGWSSKDPEITPQPLKCPSASHAHYSHSKQLFDERG